MFSEAIGVMLLMHGHYRQFTQPPIGDARRESQALLALSVASRDAVNAILERPRPPRAASVPIRCRPQVMSAAESEDTEGNVWEHMWRTMHAQTPPP